MNYKEVWASDIRNPAQIVSLNHSQNERKFNPYPGFTFFIRYVIQSFENMYTPLIFVS